MYDLYFVQKGSRRLRPSGGCRYEEAFGRVLDMADVSRVTWMCQQLDPAQLLNMEPLPLSQSVLLSLMQQLGSDLSKVCLPDLSLTLLPHLRVTSSQLL